MRITKKYFKNYCKHWLNLKNGGSGWDSEPTVALQTSPDFGSQVPLTTQPPFHYVDFIM